MKKVMLIAKQNDELKELAASLSGDYTVQSAEFEQNVVKDVLEVFKPDVIVISLENIYESGKALLMHISTEYADTPVITLGTTAETEIFAQYYKENRFENIFRPADAADVRSAIERRLSGGGIGAARSRAYILVIDDDMSVLRSVKAILEDEYDVAIAPSGMAGIKMMDKRLPDLVLLDYEMPHCDGRQTLEMIRTIDKTRELPVMFLTSMTDKDHIDGIMGLSPHGYLVKPADPVKLKESIERVLYYL